MNAADMWKTGWRAAINLLSALLLGTTENIVSGSSEDDKDADRHP